MNDWPHLPVIRQLPFAYRLWAAWLRKGPRRAEGTLGGSAAFRLLARAGRLISRREHAYAVLETEGRAKLTIDLRDFESFHHVIPVWYRGDKESAILRAVMTRGGTYIDAGANYGVYALSVAMLPNVRVIAVEPQPSVARALRSSKDANHFDHFEVIEAALDETSGSREMAVGTGSGTASFNHDRLSAEAHTISVPAMTLDELAAQCQIDGLRCLKLDVEGAEASVVRGGLKLLKREQPVVVFEASRSYPQEEVFALLQSIGYSEFWDRDTFGSRSPVAPRLDANLTNIVAVSPRYVDDVRELLTVKP